MIDVRPPKSRGFNSLVKVSAAQAPADLRLTDRSRIVEEVSRMAFSNISDVLTTLSRDWNAGPEHVVENLNRARCNQIASGPN
jgi:hypothetical protein